MVVNQDAAVTAGDRVVDDPLDVDVELVRHPVDHVHPDDADAEAGGRGDARLLGEERMATELWAGGGRAGEGRAGGRGQEGATGESLLFLSG